MGVEYNCFLSHYYLDLLTIYVKNKHKKKKYSKLEHRNSPKAVKGK